MAATISETQQQTPSLPDQILHPERQPIPSFAFSSYLQQHLPSLGAASKLHRPICHDYRSGHCLRGPNCPDRHTVPHSDRHGSQHLICKHYQRGLCKRPDTCEYAHTFNLRDERECKEFSKYGLCPAGDDCTYLHVHPNSPARRQACPHYTRGFCPLGPYCALRHIKHRNICPFYLAGFCPNGRSHPPEADKVVTCEFGAHAKWIADNDLHPKKPEVRKREDEERETKEQELREDDYYAEAEELRRKQDRGEAPRGRWGAHRGRRPGRGFRRN